MIEIRNLTKRFGDTVAVDDISFDVVPGRVTGFLGPNGSGKSTTMRMIMGLDWPTSGTVTVNERPYEGLRRPLFEVGALLDANAVHGGRNAYNHLLSLAQSNGIPRGRVDEVIERVGLESVARKRAGGFSLGMSQRLGIAAALLGDPGVMLFDEPVNGLDPEGIRWIRKLLRSFAAEGRTILISSHLMSEMALTADHLIVIGRGRLIADTSVEAFIAQSTKSFVRVRSPQLDELAGAITAQGGSTRPEPDGALAVSGVQISAIGEVARNAGIALHELSPQVASLEEAFMELTRESVQFHAGADAAHTPAAVGQEG
ncbi:MAG TPA: ATP-binding cassette domain-containing protein [Solirubrobacteraceae bacterium]|nr:ATP-binding cassette domain-containing protein [Solirubrobacteraceae bacterium]